MGGTRYLVVNADDFGLSAGVNRGVVEAHDRGIVTSASLRVRWPAAAAAVAAARDRSRLGLGLHVDLGEWAYSDGEWRAVYEVVPAGDPDAAAAEVAAQVAAFHRLVGRPPTHLDSHQHVHTREPARSVLVRWARDLGVPLRHCSPGVRYDGRFYGQTATGAPHPEGVEEGALLQALAELTAGATEVCCHPGYADDLPTAYRAERAAEVASLCSPRVRRTAADAGAVLGSFADLPRDLCGVTPP
ncbi:MAG TPA: ChbG/HpnK family deacetylase [Urbifossiella sp.]|nr:ChbG/HpnK family deacetylase [Urbifossiella sp.]